MLLRTVFSSPRCWKNRGDVASEDHLLKRLWFENNIVLARTESLLTMRHATPTFNLVFDRNVYWREGGGPITFFGLSWEAWRAQGLDAHSIFADPGLEAAEKDIFRLKPDAPALTLGFEPLDFSDVGPRNRGGEMYAA